MPEQFGALLRSLREQAERTQDQQADAVNLLSGRPTTTRREISRYEQGETIPTRHSLVPITASFGLPPGALDQEAAAARARRRAAREHREGDDDMRRRTAITGGAALIGTALTSTPWDRLAHALARGSSIDQTTADTLVGRAAQLHVAELDLPAVALRADVETHLDTITAALPRAGTHERALVVAAGETAALAGWLAWDLGDRHAATGYYGVTMHCAARAGHPPLRALALGYTSYGATTPGEALEALAEAARHVRGPGNATAAAWIYGRYAEEAAHTDPTAALCALDRARTVYDFADNTEAAWVRFMTPARVDALTLSVYGLLGRPELATTAAEATRRLGHDRAESGVVILGDLALALLRGGRAEEGAEVAHEFATAAGTRPTAMGRTRAGLLATAVPTNRGGLAERLHALAA
ncbi:helix-turn-helix transcriptional regulator (plasmid) [Streptomyces sp. BI20]|uniref:helix-turn-helix transcriptional regulator n=1 Tax=Streptomyces sp. BI20 TaxID=3403460 RepID=UPI003C73232A